MTSSTSPLLAVLSALFLAVAASPPVNDATRLAALASDPSVPFRVRSYPQFAGQTLADVPRRWLGIQPSTAPVGTIVQWPSTESSMADLPPAFSWRQERPECVHPVLNQGQCGSCWAFGSSEAFSDRLCLDSNGTVNVVLAPQQLLACSRLLDFGCDGGLTQTAWDYIADKGLVSMDCWPYETEGWKDKCVFDSGVCPNATATFQPHRCDRDTVHTYVGEEAVMRAVLEGPVQAVFMVFADFMNYESGVYEQHSWDPAGLHTIKVTGWGEWTDPTSGQVLPYWECQNSWGTAWGEDGYFRIVRGKNECGIETDVVAGHALL